MALITSFSPLQKDRNTVHGPVDCSYTIFETSGGSYLQLDTYGSSERQFPGKTSQSIQLNEESAREFIGVIRKAFPGLGS